MLGLLLAALACGSGESSEEAAPAAERPTFAFSGRVEAVDTVTDKLTVTNDDVPGWMAPMSMSYSVDHPEVLDQLTVGTRVRATVYGGDFGMLYGVEVER